MFCKFCGGQIHDDSELCTQCGRRVRGSVSTFLQTSDFTQPRPIETAKSPGLAGTLGFILGWLFLGPVGYLYLGQWNWFWLTLVITLVAYPLTVGLAYVLFPFIFALHQFQMARELNAMHAATTSAPSPAPGEGSTPDA